MLTTESAIYSFLKEEFPNINVYRGVLPDVKFSENEKESIFPFALLRIASLEQVRAGINTYDTSLEFEVWIGSKEEEYIEHIRLGEKMLKILCRNGSVDKKFSLNEEIPVNLTFHSEEKQPFLFSVLTFTAFGCPEESQILKKWR